MRLAKLTTAALLSILALTSVSAIAQAAPDSGSGSGTSSSGNSSNSTDANGNGVSPVVMPPVIIKPDGDVFEGSETWEPPHDKDMPQGKPPHLPRSSTIPFDNDQPGWNALNGSGGQVGAVTPPSYTVTTHQFVVSPISPTDSPTVVDLHILSGTPQSTGWAREVVDPGKNQPINFSGLSFSTETPMQQFANVAAIVLGILGLLSIGLVGVAVRNARASKRDYQA